MPVLHNLSFDTAIENNQNVLQKWTADKEQLFNMSLSKEKGELPWSNAKDENVYNVTSDIYGMEHWNLISINSMNFHEWLWKVGKDVRRC